MEHHKIPELYHVGQKRKHLIFAVLILLLIAVAVLALDIGTIAIPQADVIVALGHTLFLGIIDPPATQNATFTITNFRIPRILLAVLAGVSLVVSGTIIQGLLR